MSGHAARHELDQVVALRGSHASDTRRRLDHVGCTWANTRTSRYTVVQVEFDRCWDGVVFKNQSRRGTFQVRKAPNAMFRGRGALDHHRPSSLSGTRE
jgi:hypothetical protein